MQWMKERDEDVVVVQELFNLRDKVIDGMAAAGFCHYVSTPFDGDGSGLAIFSKHRINAFDFIDWFDWTGTGSTTLPDFEALADKGVMYARIKKDGQNYHIFNTHTQSSSWLDYHYVRKLQYEKIREFAKRVTGFAPGELILYAGDFNEDKNKTQYYEEMLNTPCNRT